MKKNIVLTSLFALVMACPAYADTDVTFAGDYQLGNGSTANVGTALNGSTYTYTYTKSDSTTATVAQNVNPDLSYFTYTDKDGNSADLSTGGTGLTAADFVGATSADGTSVISNQTIAANETISRDNYQYVDGKGETVTLGDSARSFTETVVLNSDFATVTSVDVTDGSTAPVLTGDMYSYTDPDTGAVYHLNATGDAWVDENNNVQTPDVGTPQEAARDAMVNAFLADSAAIAAAKTTVDGYAAAEATAFAAADAVYNTDEGTISTLTNNYGTYTDATALLGQAQSAQSARQDDFAADQALENAAADLYNAPILDTITSGANDAIDSALADGGDIANAIESEADRATAAEAVLDGKIAANADNIADNAAAIESEADRATAAEAALDSKITANADNIADNAAAIKSEADRATAAEAVLDGKITANAGAIKAEEIARVAADELMLGQAKAYTDAQINSLEEELSAGIASAVAMSSVAVSNVAKGEVSVGGGYGYYNSQSAFAFGAAMGLSDNWSVNAAAGLSDSNVTFRAGTNYKFKLF